MISEVVLLSPCDHSNQYNMPCRVVRACVIASAWMTIGNMKYDEIHN